MSSNRVVGIDLGTTFSCVAHYANNKVEVIPDQTGKRLIRSYVYYDPDTGKVFVGEIAYEKATVCPQNGLWDIKRIIGRKYDDNSLLKYKNDTPFLSLVRGENDLAAFEITIGGEKVVKSPEEVSSEILKYLRSSASSYLRATIKEVVISIPAYFNNAQRKATKKAAELAGLTVLRLVTEPTAGAIHYIQDKNIDAKLLVFDWGGGTLDISLVEVKNKRFVVKAVYGDTLLGGRNIDEILLKHFYIPIPKSSVRYIRRLLQECIVIKEQLLIENEVTKILDHINQGEDMTLSMTREKFEELTEDVFKRILNIIEYSLYDSGWNKNDVDCVLLVGGSTRIPKVAGILKEFFNIDELKTDLNPDEAVACGASIQAALLKDHSQFLENYHITEVTPLSLGIGSSGHNANEELFFKLIERNSSLPVSKTKMTTTASNDQTSMKFRIYEGERKNCINNNKLGEFIIENLPPRRSGEIKVSVNFNLDEDGILTVTATDVMDPSNSNNIVVSMEEFRLSERRMELSIEEAKIHKHEDEVFEEFVLQKMRCEIRCDHILYDIDKISDRTKREFVSEQCNKFLNETSKLKFTDIEDLKGKFQVMLESVSDILKSYKMLEINNQWLKLKSYVLLNFFQNMK